MSQTVRAMVLILLCLTAREGRGQEAVRDFRESIAKQFEGVYRFNYLFSENGTLYLDESSHRQLLDFDKAEGDERHGSHSLIRLRKAKSAPITAISFIRTEAS